MARTSGVAEAATRSLPTFMGRCVERSEIGAARYMEALYVAPLCIVWKPARRGHGVAGVQIRGRATPRPRRSCATSWLPGTQVWILSDPSSYIHGMWSL